MALKDELTKKVKGLNQTQATQIRYEGNYGGGLSKILPRIDKLLKHKNDLAEAYDDILNDGHLQGLISSRKSGTLSLDWDIQTEKSNDKISELIYYVLDNYVDIYELMNNILDAKLYGMQPIELIWDNVDGKFTPTVVEAKPFNWFAFDEDNKLRFMVEGEDDGEECLSDKYLLPRSGATYANPYGVGLLSLCYWNVYFKKHGKDYWAEFCEKYGAPWTIGNILNTSTDEKAQEDIEATLVNLISNGIATKNETWEIDTIFPATKQSGDIFKQFIDDSKIENSVIFLGHEASTAAQAGKLGNDENALTAAERLIKEDKRLVQKTINHLIQLIAKHNFPNETDLPYFVFFEEENLNTEKADRDKILYDMGFEFSEEYIQQAYGFQQGQIVKRKPPTDNSTTKAEAKKTDFFNLNSSVILNQKITQKNHGLIDELVDHLYNDDDTHQHLARMLLPVFKDVRTAKSLEDLRDNYHKNYKKMNGSKYQDLMTRVVNIVDILGYDAAYQEEQPLISGNNNLILNKNPDEITFEDILEALKKTPEKAVEYFKKKGLKISENSTDRIKAIKAHAFTVTGVTKLDILKDYKDLILKAIEEGITLNDFKKELTERLSTKGWTSRKDGDNTLPPWRLNNIFRTNTMEMYSQAKWDQFQETIDLVPYISCFSVVDKNTTEKCKWLNGKFFRKDDKTFAKFLRSIGHYHCRRADLPASELDVKGKKVWKGKDVPKKYWNDKEFYKQAGGYTPDLSKYDKELSKEYEEEHS
jgi:SPP1 gp7 family putative phage head morphogenesis protein